MERQLFDEVLELKTEVQHLSVLIERQTNAVSQTQMLSQRDIETHSKRLDAHDEKIVLIEKWQDDLDRERSEQRGAARVRKSMLAVIAGLASLFGSVVGALVGWWLRQV